MLLDERRFQPGQKVSVEMLSRELGVSRSPVWSAIARLDAEGLVDVSPRQGVYLAAFDEERLRSLYETREALEGMATRLAAKRMTSDEIASLMETLVAQKKCLDQHQPAEYAAAALQFHEQILRGAGNSLIEQQLSGVYARTSAMCRGKQSMQTPEVLKSNFKDHSDLIKALRRRDEAACETLARAHVRRLMAAAMQSNVKAARSSGRGQKRTA